MSEKETLNEDVQEFEYKAEMKQLLHLIIHSLYTNQEIFLRELVSNASDALNKVRFRRLTDTDILDPEAELKIKIALDKENETFSIEDNGIGMTRDELIKQIGTVASSGTLEFLKKMQDDKKSLDANMIGQFGVGFYSVFMVTDQITVETRNVEKDSKAYRWVSKGDDKFTIEEIDRETRGTKITFKLKEDFKDFYEDYRVKGVLKKYSNFVDFPIYIADEEVNQVTALWHRKKDDIKDEELQEFYKFISNDFQDPLGHLHVAIEGNINFKALLFVPSMAPPAMFRDASEKSLHLYSNKVFIQDDSKDLLPDYLGFIKGVVDTEDLPLNVSREVTQSSPVMAKIRNVISGKLLGLFEDWAENDKEKFKKFFENFGSMFKIGVNSDFTNKDRIVNLLRFETSKTEKGELKSFKEYVDGMKEGQKEIYYLSGDYRDVLERNPKLEYFNKQGIEVIFLTDPVDIFTIPYITDYEDKPLKSIEKEDLDLGDAEEKSQDSLEETQAQSLILTFKDELGDKVEDVVESKRLVDSPATLVVGKQGLDPQMEKMMQMMDKNYATGKKILEINTSHKLIKNLSALNKKDSFSPTLRKAILQIWEGASLIDGDLKSPTDFMKRMVEFMEEATKE